MICGLHFSLTHIPQVPTNISPQEVPRIFHPLCCISTNASLLCRYDGLYTVKYCWHQMVPGVDGQLFRIWRYHMQSVDDYFPKPSVQLTQATDVRTVTVSVCLDNRSRIVLGAAGFGVRLWSLVFVSPPPQLHIFHAIPLPYGCLTFANFSDTFCPFIWILRQLK